jgi:hypothetical protein
MKTIPIERLHELFVYDPDTGILTNRATRSSRARIGDETGWRDVHGYRRVMVDGSRLYVHRIAFAMTFGRWPENEVDHQNGDRIDNRISNLREATHSENLKNTSFQINNKSGRKGVHWDAERRRWLAQIMVGGKHMHLGRFRDLDAASEAYESAAKLHFGDFARTLS